MEKLWIFLNENLKKNFIQAASSENVSGVEALQ